METLFKQLRVANYNRKSQDSEDKQVLSIPSQREEAQKIATALGISSLDLYEEAKSAKAANHRPVFRKLLEDIKTGKVNAILCWKLDRIARNMDEGGEVIDLLQRGVIQAIITPSKTYLPNENALLMAVEFGSANQFSRDLSVNVKRGQTKKASLGYPHGLAALGYKNDKSDEKGNRKWLVDEEKFPQVKHMFELYLSGMWSVGKLARYLRNDLKLRTPKHKKIGGALVATSWVYRLLKNPIYAGFFYYGDKRYELHPSLPRIITEQQHEKIQRMISQKHLPKSKSHVGIFTGFIKSPYGDFIGQDIKHQLICDCKFKFSYQNKTHCPKCSLQIDELENPKYLIYQYYYNIKRKKMREQYKSISETVVGDFLVEYVQSNLKLSPALAQWSRKYIHELKDKELENNQLEFSSVSLEREKLEQKKKKLRQLLADEYITPEEYKSDIQDVDSKLAACSQKNEVVDWYSRLNEIIDLTEECVAILKSDDVDSKRKLLLRLGSNLVWDEEKLSIINTKPIQVLIDGLKETKTKNPQFEPENIIDTSSQNEVFEDIRPIMLRGLDSNQGPSR